MIHSYLIYIQRTEVLGFFLILLFIRLVDCLDYSNILV